MPLSLGAANKKYVAAARDQYRRTNRHLLAPERNTRSRTPYVTNRMLIDVAWRAKPEAARLGAE